MEGLRQAETGEHGRLGGGAGQERPEGLGVVQGRIETLSTRPLTVNIKLTASLPCRPLQVGDEQRGHARQPSLQCSHALNLMSSCLLPASMVPPCRCCACHCRWAMNNVAMPVNPPCNAVMRDIATSPGVSESVFRGGPRDEG